MPPSSLNPPPFPRAFSYQSLPPFMPFSFASLQVCHSALCGLGLGIGIIHRRLVGTPSKTEDNSSFLPEPISNKGQGPISPSATHG